MNDLEQTLDVILQKALEIATQTGEFVMEQAPLLLQEFYNWHISMHILGIILGIAFMIMPFFISRLWGYKEEQKDKKLPYKLNRRYYYKSEEVPAYAVLIIGNLIGIIIFIIHIYKLIFVLVAPRIYLIEYFTK